MYRRARGARGCICCGRAASGDASLVPGGRDPFSTALPGWSRIGARSRASLPNSPGFARTMRCADRCTLLLHPDVVTEALRRLTEPDPTTEPPEQQRARLQRDLAQVERELAHFTEAIAAGGSTMESVLKAIKLREQQRDEVQHALSRLDLQTVAPLDVSALRPRITALLADMRGLAGRHVRRVSFYASSSWDVSRSAPTPSRRASFASEAGHAGPDHRPPGITRSSRIGGPNGIRTVFESRRAFANIVGGLGRV